MSTTFESFVREFVPMQPSFTLAEVAKLTRFSEGSLAEGCRAGRIEHQHYGRQRTMTRPQVIDLMRATWRPAKDDSEPVLDEAEVARINQARNRAMNRIARKQGERGAA